MKTMNNSKSSSTSRRSVVSTMIVTTMLALSGGSNNSFNSMVVNAVPNPSASASAGAAALKALKAMDYRYFVAGGTCAAFSHGITTPIDVVKTKLQADPKKYDGKGLIGATIQICRDKEEGGPSALLNGLGPTVFGYGIEGAMKFGVYEVMKPIFLALLGSSNKVVAFMFASFIAGSVAAVLLVPMESLRIKQVTDPSYANENIMTGLPRIIQQDGFFIMMSGVWAMLAKQVPYTFGKQVSFDLIAKFLYEVSSKIDSLSPTQVKWIVSIFSAMFASVVACLFSQPGDMILTKTYNTNEKGDNKPGNFNSVVKEIYNSPYGGGVSEFFRGTKARIVHVGMIITSQLVVYDLVKQLLGLPATGAH